MPKTVTIEVFTHVGLTVANNHGSAEKVHALIQQALRAKHKINLSFDDIEMCTPTFLQIAIGQLYSEFDEGFIKQYLTVSKMYQADMHLLKDVVENAKRFFNKEKNNVV